MRKNILLISFTALSLFSCKDNKGMTEVKIPERVAFKPESKEIPSPNSIRTNQGPFEMPALDYNFDELEEISTAQSLLIHFENFHLENTNRLNSAIHSTIYEKDSIQILMRKVTSKESNLKNLAGAHYNHILFWKSITPKNNLQPSEALSAAITASFGSLDGFKSAFKQEAIQHIGSGWIWLVKKGDQLRIVSTSNNDNPLMPELNLGIPLLGVDLWEHAYVTTHQNNKEKYISAILNHLNWDNINKAYIKE